MRRNFILILSGFFSLLSISAYSQTLPMVSPSAPTTQPGPADSGWKITKEKSFPFYKVQIFTKDNRAMPFGLEGSKAVITHQKGKVMAEVKSLLIEPDPRETIEGWVPGTLLDLDKDGLEDLVLRSFSGGAHCCYSYQIFSLGKVFKKLGDLKLQDCGEKIRLQDLNGDGVWELISCNSSFTYFKDIAYAQSPFPPQVFGLENGKFINHDKKNTKIFEEDIAQERKNLQERGYADGDVLQIVLDYFLTGRETEGWTQFDQLLNSPKKESIRNDLKDKWRKYLGLPPESAPAESRAAETKRSEFKLP